MTPTLSIIVIVYDMQAQAINTLKSLATPYQQDVSPEDYEVIVVENASERSLSSAQVESLGSQFHYTLRQEPGVSPAPAVNFAASKARGQMIGLLIDGARMLTPRALKYALAATRMYANPLVAVPGYHIGEENHHRQDEHRLQQEQQHLSQLQWQSDGYQLFEKACFSEGNSRGYFHPLMECNALFCTRASFDSIGGAQEGYDQMGGGSINLDIYRRLGMVPDNQLIVLPGEGSFHQYHAGVTTSATENRELRLEEFNDKLNSFWDGQYKALTREPVYFGKVPAAAQRFLQLSCEQGIKRFARFERSGKSPWPDDQAIQPST